MIYYNIKLLNIEQYMQDTFKILILFFELNIIMYIIYDNYFTVQVKIVYNHSQAL